MAPMYYRGVSSAVIVFDITSEQSFTDMQGWVQGTCQSRVNRVPRAQKRAKRGEEREIRRAEGCVVA